MRIVLHQFEMSHFNDKARWALAFKGVQHERVSYLPGPHIPAIRKLSGQPQTPVLCVDDDVVAGSAAIIDRLERLFPDPALYPAEGGERDAALALQTRFDTEVGPATRTAIFSKLVDDGGYLCRMFARSKPLPKRLLYRAAFPLARPLIAKGNGVDDPENVARAFEITQAALDEVADKVAASGYLVGGRFTVADLTVAALFAPLANPAHPDMSRPQPIPQSIASLLARYADHPAVAWVNRMYAEHR